MTTPTYQTIFERRSPTAIGVQQRLAATATGPTPQTVSGINPSKPSAYAYSQEADPGATWDKITANKAAEVKMPKQASRAVNKPKPQATVPAASAPSSMAASSAAAPSAAAPVKVTFKKEYPLDLPVDESSSYYLQIMLGPYDVNTAIAGKGVQHDTSIAFPVPSNLLTATALDYTNINLGAFGGEFLQSAVRLGDAANNGDFFGQLRNEVNVGVRALFGDNGNVRQLIARRIVSGLSPTLGSAIDLASGSTPNPHVAVTFNNVKLRSFTYTWKFSPNSKDESARLQEIIQKLHQRILPRKSGSMLLQYPNQCQLRLFPAQLNELFKFKPCVIDSMNVNYAPSGTPSFFAETKLPTEIELSMTFHEIQLRTAEDYMTQQGTGATE